MMNFKTYWEHVYATKASDEVSWFQHTPATSLRLLETIGLTPTSWIIDIGGGDSRLAQELINRGLTCVTVLDVSGPALARAKARMSKRSRAVRWIEADVTGDWNAGVVDIWHDRATFHFLTEATQRIQYAAHLRRSVRPGGHVIIATFAADGPTRCSGLPIVRYSPETLAAELGGGFSLLHALHDAHETPSGSIQQFTFAVFCVEPAP